MKRLINLSNHHSSKWSEEQKKGWDEIIDISFPQIDPDWTVEELIEKAVTPVAEKLGSLAEKENYICLLGEYTFCYLLKKILEENFVGDKWYFCIPTTARIVKEEGNKKVATFKFVRWRII